MTASNDPAINSAAERAARGDTEALRDLLVEHLPAVEAYIRLRAGKLLKDKGSCSDLLQSFCVQALRQLDQFEFRSEPEFRGWLFKNALHKLINRAEYHRAGKRDVEREVDLGDYVTTDGLGSCYASILTPSRHADGREALAQFEAAFAELPDDYQEAITLSRLGGLSYEEIATDMGRSVGAVRNLVYRGLAKLAARLD